MCQANCVTELLPAAALKRAQYLDDYLATQKRPVGPLHGLPISVKEHIGMKGLGLNGGFVSWWDHKGEDDALILKLLWNAGCVFYVRTTQPQTLMHLETLSNLYGETVCPFNRKLTSGGSSGGEGALVGLRGSCLGIGTDIGGSIRSPAANNGVYGFRPTSYRLPTGGFTATMLGQEHIVPVVGPLSTSL
jgi:amidase